MLNVSHPALKININCQMHIVLKGSISFPIMKEQG